MFLTLWNYLRGYVIIKVSGFSVERFVNMAAYRGIYLWDMHPEGGYVSMKVCVSAFRNLKECARKTGCHYKISGRAGMPFKIRGMKNRKAYSIGVMSFVIVLYILSSIIWTVQIEGAKRISDAELKTACSDLGLAPGRLKRNIDVVKVSEKLIENFEDIAWVAVNINGTRARVTVSETIQQKEIIDRNTPCHVVAAKDGVIISITVSGGTPAVEPGDVVKKGDILISGIVVIKDGETEIGTEEVKAQGSVYAKQWFDLSETETLQYTQKIYTDNTKTDFSLILKNSIVNFIKPNLEEKTFDKVLSEHKMLAIGDYKFPIGIARHEYREYINEVKTRTLDEATKAAEISLQNTITKLEMEENGELIEIETEYISNDSELEIKARAAILERIDEQVPILNSERGSMNGTNRDNGSN